jgi:hypothetical protein
MVSQIITVPLSFNNIDESYTPKSKRAHASICLCFIVYVLLPTVLLACRLSIAERRMTRQRCPARVLLSVLRDIHNAHIEHRVILCQRACIAYMDISIQDSTFC